MNQEKHMPTANGGGRKLRNDLILVGCLLAVILGVALCVLLFAKEGDTVTVTVDGVLYGTYALDEDRTVDIRTGEDQLNRLVIKDGKAFVETATCPDGICAAHKPISRQGESIACLPHRVVVTVHVTSGDDAPDIIA